VCLLKANQGVVCKDRAKIIRRKIKLEVIEAYGGKCQCPGGCDVTDPDFLTVDHVLGDGAKHRKESGLVGSAIYSWLRRENFQKVLDFCAGIVMYPDINSASVLMSGSWTRNCPLCKRLLEKRSPLDIVKCVCGWIWR